MNFNLVRILTVLAVIFVAAGTATAGDVTGKVFDATTGAGIGDATVTADGRAVRSDGAGNFAIKSAVDTIQVRAPGYARREVDLRSIAGPAKNVSLMAFSPKAIYLSSYGIASTVLRGAALKLIRETALNAIVIDVKGDRGMVAYRSAVPLAAEIGAQKLILIKDLPGLLRGLHAEGIYTIARIVAFKDDPLGSARPDLALKGQDGSAFIDREGLRWVDPNKAEVRDYNIAIAEEAARAGFDEIQFDYLRFPDSSGVHLPLPNTEATRTQAISDFLDAVRARLLPYNVFLSTDVFGYICWNLDDTKIGQRLEDLLARVDYLSPMLYPSGFQYGIPGYRNPVDHPYEIVRLSLDRVLTRTGVSPLRLRPWLQAFKDYAFDGRSFDADDVSEQIRAAEEFGSAGWMLWNPRNMYSVSGLEAEKAAACCQ